VCAPKTPKRPGWRGVEEEGRGVLLLCPPPPPPPSAYCMHCLVQKGHQLHSHRVVCSSSGVGLGAMYAAAQLPLALV
jgi:hypothetical protein